MKLNNVLKFIPKTFHVGDKFELENNEKHFTIEVTSMRGPEEIQIMTKNMDGPGERTSYTDALELSDRLRHSKTWKRITA